MPMNPRFTPVIAAALLIMTSFAQAQDEPRPAKKLPEGMTAVTKSHLIASVPNFFSFDYPFEPQPGKRLWLRVDDKHWVERYPDGAESRYRMLGRAIVRGESGTVVGKIEGDPGKTQTPNDDSFQVFIPDRNNEEKAILFRDSGSKSEWLDMSWSEKRKTIIKQVE